MDYAKYKFYTTDNKVIAVSSYAGKTVRAVAKCSPKDSFDLERGKQLAALRCEVKIAQKRMKRAFNEHDKALKAYSDATLHMQAMAEYEKDATKRYNDAVFELTHLLSEI